MAYADRSVEGSGCHRRTCTRLYVPDPASPRRESQFLWIVWNDVFREVFHRFPPLLKSWSFTSSVGIWQEQSTILAGHYKGLMVYCPHFGPICALSEVWELNGYG